MKKRITKSIPVLLAIWLVFALMGCESLPIKINTNIQDIFYGEAGYFLAYEELKYESQNTQERIQKSIDNALNILDDTSPIEMTDIIIEYVKKNVKMDNNPPTRRALRLLKQIVKIDINMPGGHDKAKNALRLFLEGAKDGIDDLLS